MKQLAVISGKGGTGKTSLTAAFATLAAPVVTADCDVDAADLHLLLEPKIKQTTEFTGGLTASIDIDECTWCGECRSLCRFDAISADFVIDPFACEGCGVCHDNCPVQCITLTQEIAGDWYVSDTRFGPMVHARLGIAQENSGKLVAQVRQKANDIASEQGKNLVIIDGSPGIGCPVISSITGADMTLVVTEPTMSGKHDLLRVLELTQHFSIPTAVCVNKYDLNPQVGDEIKQLCKERGIIFAGKVPFDSSVTNAMVERKTLPEFGDGDATKAIREIWTQITERLFEAEETHADL